MTSDIDTWYPPKMVLNFDLRAQYSVSIEYGAKFLSQTSKFRVCRIWCLILISELDIRCPDEIDTEFWPQLNMVLNFDLRARHSVSTEYGAEFR